MCAIAVSLFFIPDLRRRDYPVLYSKGYDNLWRGKHRERGSSGYSSHCVIDNRDRIPFPWKMPCTQIIEF